MANISGPNTANPIIEILKANNIDPDMMVSRVVVGIMGEETIQVSAFSIIEAAIGAALDEIEETETGQKD